MFQHISPSNFSCRFGSVYQSVPIATEAASWQENRHWETRLDEAFNTYLTFINSAEQSVTFDSDPTIFIQTQNRLNREYRRLLLAVEELPEAFQKAVPACCYFLEDPSDEWAEALANYRKGQFYAGALQYEQGVRNLMETGSGRIPSKSWSDLDRLYDALIQEKGLYPELELQLPEYSSLTASYQQELAERTSRAAYRALSSARFMRPPESFDDYL